MAKKVKFITPGFESPDDNSFLDVSLRDLPLLPEMLDEQIDVIEKVVEKYSESNLHRYRALVGVIMSNLLGYAFGIKQALIESDHNDMEDVKYIFDSYIVHEYLDFYRMVIGRICDSCHRRFGEHEDDECEVSKKEVEEAELFNPFSKPILDRTPPKVPDKIEDEKSTEGTEEDRHDKFMDALRKLSGK